MKQFPKRNKISRRCDFEKNVCFVQLVNFTPRCFWYSIGRSWYNHWFKKLKRERVTSQVVCKVDLKPNCFTTLKKAEKEKFWLLKQKKIFLK